MKNALVEIFAENDAFRLAARPALEALAGRAQERRFRNGQMIFETGQASDALYAVLEGRVRIFRTSLEGDEVTLGLIDAGQIFGEIAVIDGGGRTASAETAAACRIATVPRQAFLRFLQENASAATKLLQIVCGRLRDTMETLDAVAFLGLEARLARLLVKLADQYGVEQTDGLLIDLRLGHKELGAFIATTRESIGKQLGRWRDEGLVERRQGQLLIRDRAALEELARLEEVI